MPSLTIDVLPLKTPTRPALLRQGRSPPHADAVVSMLRSLTVDDDYFHRRALRKLCTQKTPIDDFLPQASEIIPGLFVSDVYTATSPSVIQRLGITHVASVVSKPLYRYTKPIQHLCVPVDDKEDANLLDYLDSTVKWLRDALNGGGRVLVHCVWGMSRSATVAIAYLIVARGMTLDHALKVARSRRRVIRPNAGFMSQLKIYEKVTRLREAHARAATKLPKELIFDLELGALTRRQRLAAPP
ncbi:phosphatases II [Pilatotrama ljubarskyi]|nr:phosphatases II [Pilatotrama ljubarskyi]